MKTSIYSMTRTLGLATLIAVSLLSYTSNAEARDKDDRRGGSDNRGHDHRYDDNDRRRFFAQPRSSYRINIGNGYAGRGYYYGPPNCNYYYQGSGVVYYSNRDRVPAHYWGGNSRPQPHGSVEVAVQRALAQRGYYRGPIDGVIGAMGQRAIRSFQADRRLAVTGNINKDVLRALGLL